LNIAISYDIRENLVIQEGIVSIGKSAFENAIFRNVFLPKSLKEMHDYCFFHESRFDLIEISSPLEYVGRLVVGGDPQGVGLLLFRQILKT